MDHFNTTPTISGQTKHHFKAEIGKTVSTTKAEMRFAGAYKRKSV